MGNHTFFKPSGMRIGPSNLNMQARANAAPVFAGRAAGAVAAKDVGQAQALSKGVLKPSKKSAPDDAKGPKV